METTEYSYGRMSQLPRRFLAIMGLKIAGGGAKTSVAE
jgi:hypothetical protein